ncbi:MAG: hypothetical protein JWO95_2662 [Verrucomicrobiales bacterium]|nr:hypothetical protein [Verrucomicrobiales bacterium]
MWISGVANLQTCFAPDWARHLLAWSDDEFKRFKALKADDHGNIAIKQTMGNSERYPPPYATGLQLAGALICESQLQ